MPFSSCPSEPGRDCIVLKRITGLLLLLSVILPTPKVSAVDYVDDPWSFRTYDYVGAATDGTRLELDEDGVSDETALGFSITYYGTDYSSVYVSANGMIGFDPVGLDAATLPSIPDATAPNGVIAPLASDLDPSAGGSIYTRAAGAAGQRIFVVEWIGVPVAGLGGSRTFAVVLYEDNGDILFQYRTLRGGDTISAGTTTVGLENGDGSAGIPANLADILEDRSLLFYGVYPDTDGDGMLDRFERFFGLDPDTNDGNQDNDGDGLTNLEEFNGGTRPTEADSDGDGLSDGVEVNDLGTDPLAADTDLDGIREGQEDINKDGARDMDETDPASADTDGDDYSDAVEYTYGADPLSGATAPALGHTVVTGSVQSAIDGASAGDILYVPPGVHAVDASLSVSKAVTLIGAGADLTTLALPDGMTITGVSGAVLTGFAIQGGSTAPAIRIEGSATAPTEATLVKITLKDCADGVLVSGAAQTTVALIDQLTFEVAQATPVGYGIRVLSLSNDTDAVNIRNATLSLTGDAAAVLIENSRAVTVSGSTVSSANGAGIRISDGTGITVDNNAIRSNFGDGVQVTVAGTGITLNRNSISGHSGRGILISGSADAAITDNLITSNEVGIESSSTGTVTNSGNALSSNTTDYIDPLGSLNQNESPASAVGATSAGKKISQAAAWITAASGGTVAVLDPPAATVDPITSLFGASIALPPNAISQDTRVTIFETRESVPALPGTFGFPMPLAAFELENADLVGTATITLPVLAGFDTDTARVYRLSGNRWQEITGLTKHDHGQTAVHQQVSFETETLGTFALVVDLPILDRGDPGGGSGCALSRGSAAGPTPSALLDGLLGFLPLLYLMLRRKVIAAKGHPATGE